MSNKNKKGLVPEVRFPEFQDAQEWKSERFDNIYDLKTTNSFSRDKLNYDTGEVKNIHYGDIHTKFSTLFDLSHESVPYVNTSESLEKIKFESYCQESDIVFADASEDIEDIGKSIELINLNDEKVLAGLHTILARQKHGHLVTGFGGYLFKSSIIRKQIRRESQGTKVLGISAGRISKIEVPYPSNKKEQQKITDCLTSIDDLITAHEKKLASMKNKRKGLVQKLFPSEGEKHPKLRFSEFYGRWKLCSIQDLIDSEILLPPKDGNHGNIHPKSSDFVKNGIPFIMASDIRDGEVDLIGCSKISKNQADALQKGFSKTGDVLLTHKGTVGEVAIVPDIDFPYIMLTPQVTYYRVINNEELSNKYLAAAFLSPSFQSHLSVVSGGGTRAYVGITEQRKLKIWMPESIAEQRKIAGVISTLDVFIKSQAKKVESLKIHKKGLLQKLFPLVSEEAYHD